MAEFPTTDEEQVEAIKKWWSENGLYLIAGVVLGLGGLFGWNYWQNMKTERAMQGSETYAELLQAVQMQDVAKATELTGILGDRYAATPYDETGYLAEASLFSRQGDLAAAEKSLRKAIDTAKIPEVKDVARLRLATVFNASGQFQQALDLVNESFPAAYTSLIEEYKGDALRGLGDEQGAAEAYDRALLSANGRTEYLQWKRNDLGARGKGAS